MDASISVASQIILPIPPLVPEAQPILEVHGCAVRAEREPLQLVLPLGTMRERVFVADSVVNEQYRLVFPDGFAVKELFDRHRELSLLHLHTHDAKCVLRLEALEARMAASPEHALLGLTQNGTGVALRLRDHVWTARVYPPGKTTATPFNAPRLSLLIGTALNLYHVQLLDIGQWEDKA